MCPHDSQRTCHSLDSPDLCCTSQSSSSTPPWEMARNLDDEDLTKSPLRVLASYSTPGAYSHGSSQMTHLKPRDCRLLMDGPQIINGSPLVNSISSVRSLCRSAGRMSRICREDLSVGIALSSACDLPSGLV